MSALKRDRIRDVILDALDAVGDAESAAIREGLARREFEVCEPLALTEQFPAAGSDGLDVMRDDVIAGLTIAVEHAPDVESGTLRRIEALLAEIEVDKVRALFGLTPALTRAAWALQDEEKAEALGWKDAQSFPAGDGESRFARTLLEDGLVYLMNDVVLHPVGLALGCSGGEDPDPLLLLMSGDAGPIYNGEAEHEIGLGRIRTSLLGAIRTRLIEAEARVHGEYLNRSGFADGDNEKIDAHVIRALEASGPCNRETIAQFVGLTRAQTSASLHRLTASKEIRDRSVNDDLTHYELVEPAEAKS